MAKRSVRKQAKKEFDFFFLVVVSAFAALTVFTASYLTQAKQKIAAEKRALDVAQLDLATPIPTPQTTLPKSPTTNKK